MMWLQPSGNTAARLDSPAIVALHLLTVHAWTLVSEAMVASLFLPCSSFVSSVSPLFFVSLFDIMDVVHAGRV